MNAAFLRRLLMLSATVGLLAVALGTSLVAAAETPAPAGHEGYVAHDDDSDGNDEDDEDDGGDGGDGGDPVSGMDDDDGTIPPPDASTPPAPVAAAPPPAATRAAAPPVTPAQLLGPGNLSPSQGRRLSTRRPVLRWRHGGRGVLVYNLQIFNRGRKVLSVFPRGGTYRVPAGRLAFDRQYVWRVWPYMRKGGYTARPLAMGVFVTPRR